MNQEQVFIIYCLQSEKRSVQCIMRKYLPTDFLKKYTRLLDDRIKQIENNKYFMKKHHEHTSDETWEIHLKSGGSFYCKYKPLVNKHILA